MGKEISDQVSGTAKYAASFYVKDLERQIKFYTESVGLQLQWKTNTAAGLGACSSNILLLTTEALADSNQGVAIRLPNRRELAKVIGRLCTINYTNRAVDNGNVQRAYLKDPEGNDIEVFVEMSSKSFHEGEPLDLESLLNELDPDDRLCDKMPDATRVQNKV